MKQKLKQNSKIQLILNKDELKVELRIEKEIFKSLTLLTWEYCSKINPLKGVD